MTLLDRPLRPELERDLLSRLDAEQAAAAALPNGPALIIAPAGSGKTTTLVARLGVLLARGVAPERIAVATFNRAAAEELSARIADRLAVHVPTAVRIEVRTLHALARQVVLDARGPQPLVADRLPLLRAVLRRHADRDDARLPEAAELDGEISAWKVEGRSPESRSLVQEYVALMRARGAVDFDDLVADAARLLESDPRLRMRWQERFTHVCVDEFQDVDAGQLRLVRLLAAPHDNIFVVGDDDQTIYAWRLADVRRILSFPDAYPGARRVQLATNYRCPEVVVAASRRLIECNSERFAKRIQPAASSAQGAVIAGFDTSANGWDEALVAMAGAEAAAGRPTCFLARTRAELMPLFAALVRAGLPHRSPFPPAMELAPAQALLARARELPSHIPAFDALRGVRVAFGWRRSDGPEALGEDEHAALDALLGWAVGFRRLDAFLEAQQDAARRLAALRRDDALVELVTVHAAKGREWQTVVVVGMEEDRFPNRRSLLDAREPDRALEEERRLAYVAMTRATRRLILAYDPSRPSRFLAEAGLLPTRPRGG